MLSCWIELDSVWWDLLPKVKLQASVCLGGSLVNSKGDPKHYHILCNILWWQFLLILHEPIRTAVDTTAPITLQNLSRESIIMPFKNMYTLFLLKTGFRFLLFSRKHLFFLLFLTNHLKIFSSLICTIFLY